MSEKPISPLRQRMIEDMSLRNFGEKTRNDYIRHVKTFTAFLGRPLQQSARYIHRQEICMRNSAQPDIAAVVRTVGRNPSAGISAHCAKLTKSPTWPDAALDRSAKIRTYFCMLRFLTPARSSTISAIRERDQPARRYSGGR
jgi:hypothetical protein